MADPYDVDPVSAHMIRETVVLLDVRESSEWARGHAPWAVHVPLSELSDRVEDVLAALRPLETTSRDGAPIICMCRSGRRSASAVKALRAEGFDARNMVGGMSAWARSGLPVVKDNGQPGRVR
jgi:rhodanese-related sulfurtransferase